KRPGKADIVGKTVRISFQREAEAGKLLLHAFDQRGEPAMAVALHDRVTIADVAGKGGFQIGLARFGIGFVPGGDVVAGDGFEIGHGLSPWFDKTVFLEDRTETNYLGGHRRATKQ